MNHCHHLPCKSTEQLPTAWGGHRCGAGPAWPQAALCPAGLGSPSSHDLRASAFELPCASVTSVTGSYWDVMLIAHDSFPFVKT